MRNFFAFFGIITALIILFGSSAFVDKNDLNKILSWTESNVNYENPQFKYSVKIPEDWVKIEDTGEYTAWLTSSAYQQTLDGKENILGVKYAIASLNNKENLSIDNWLLRYGGEDNAPLLQKETEILKEYNVTKYIYGNFIGTNRGQHVNFYIQNGNQIFSFAAFPYDSDIKTYEKDIYNLINSFQLRSE